MARRGTTGKALTRGGWHEPASGRANAPGRGASKRRAAQRIADALTECNLYDVEAFAAVVSAYQPGAPSEQLALMAIADRADVLARAHEAAGKGADQGPENGKGRR